MPRPTAAEHAPYFSTYIDLVPGADILATLHAQTNELRSFWRGIAEEQANRGPIGKWNVKQVLNHLVDTERIFAYRALRIGRGDLTPLPGFEQDDYVENSGAATRSWESLLTEYETVRRASLQLFDTFPPDAWARAGTANNGPLTPLAVAYMIAGHELHHARILRQDYL
jgi:hypothetical protein